MSYSQPNYGQPQQAGYAAYPQQTYPQQAYAQPQQQFAQPTVQYGQPPVQYIQPQAQAPITYPNQTLVAPHNEKAPHVTQPQATPNMMIIPGGGGNRNAKNLPVGPSGREWSHGFCDCCGDAGTCILAWCCPCIVYAQNKRRLDYLTQKGIADPERGGSCCSGDCWLHACITGCCGVGWILQISPRGSIRRRYNIEGGGCGDCCAAFWCTPCELTQESRELQLEEESLGVRR